LSIIQAKMAKEEDKDATYCPICYTNEITADGEPIDPKDLGTIEFDCGHRFCDECTTEQLKQ